MMRKLFAILALAIGPVASAQNVTINGAGATFPYPIYSKWFAEYNRMHPNVQINYQSIGSGGGIRQLSAGTVFFGATDGPMTNDQITTAGFRITHLPTVLGGVVPIYNVEGVGDLRFSGPVLADIFLGKITKWNDVTFRGLNPGVNLPAADITVVHRSDGSGTSYIFCDYLAKVSPDWKKTVGVATSVNWPAGVGGKGNEGGARLYRLRGADLRDAEPDSVRLRAEQGGRAREGLDGEHLGGGRRRGERDAEGLPRLDHERAGQGGVAQLVLSLA